MNNSLSLNTLKQDVPAIFATSPSPKLSNKYSFVPTVEVLEKFNMDGWNIMEARQLGRNQFGAHQVRLSNRDFKQVGDSIVQAIISNSHDGTRQFTVGAGLYRLVCSNGLTIPSSVSDELTVRHKGIQMDDIRRITDEFAKRIPVIDKSVKKFQETILTESEVKDFVNQAAMIRWASGSIPSFNMNSMLEPQRDGDNGNSMWKVFNRVQEKFVRGGESYRNQRGRQVTMRNLKSFDTVNRINTKLWELADSFC